MVPPLAWGAAALLFAALRTPYDDEWFSLGLAGQRDAARFWATLAADVHPPWVALLDRALLAATGARWLVNLARVLASAGALWITANLVRRQLGLARVYVWLAALHPIVFMYAGAARWYPFLFLAHALRALSIWGMAPGRARSGAVFVAGSALGMGAGYVEPPFVLLYFVWLHLRSAGQPHARRNLGLIALLSLAALIGLRFASPIAAAHASLAYVHFYPVLSQVVTWLVLGIAGEASAAVSFPPAGPGGGRRGGARVRDSRAPEDPAPTRSSWRRMRSCGCAWRRSGLHPRYSLEVSGPASTDCRDGVPPRRRPARRRPI